MKEQNTSCKEYKKITKATIKKAIKENDSFSGIIVGNKVNQFHILDGWHLDFEFTVTNIDEFEDLIINWSYYNTNSETGLTPAYYIKQ